MLAEPLPTSQMSVLEDPKVSADVNTAKGICLELLGCIGARLQRLIVEARVEEPTEKPAKDEGKKDVSSTATLSLAEILREQDRKALKSLAAAEDELLELLLSASGEEYTGVGLCLQQPSK